MYCHVVFKHVFVYTGRHPIRGKWSMPLCLRLCDGIGLVFDPVIVLHGGFEFPISLASVELEGVYVRILIKRDSVATSLFIKLGCVSLSP